jgi:alanine dehydrogenase
MKPGSVLVDVSIDQGGCFETSKPTTHLDPTYTVDGVVHYCVANMPGAAPRTSSEALGHATLPFGLLLADKGLDALKVNKHLAKGLNVLKGEIAHPAVAEALGKPFKDAYGAWA